MGEAMRRRSAKALSKILRLILSIIITFPLVIALTVSVWYDCPRWLSESLSGFRVNMLM